MMLALLERLAGRIAGFDGADFANPPGEPGMVTPDSISWRVFRNPVTIYVGGIAAVLLELGEPRVRHGVWDHTSFKRDPGRRMRRTGMAAMVTVYGARSQFEALAARVNKMHSAIEGETPAGQAYRADDPELLLWVQATASWAFLEAYARYAAPLTREQRNLYYREAKPSALLYGVDDPPASEAEMRGALIAMAPKLGPSAILGELIAVLRSAPILPRPLRPFQRLGVRAAIDLLPPELRRRLGLKARLRPFERRMLQRLARLAERVELPSSPAAQAERRLAMKPQTPNGPAGLANREAPRSLPWASPTGRNGRHPRSSPG